MVAQVCSRGQPIGQAPRSMREMSAAVQQLHDGEDEKPGAEYRGENAQDEDGGHSLISTTGKAMGRIRLADGVGAGPATGSRAQADPWAESGHQQECDTDDDTDVEHCTESFAALRRTLRLL
jgi:hypothetical protein